jgi:hypothetical protein
MRLAVAVWLVLWLSACEKDVDPDTPFIVNTWKLDSQVWKNCKSPSSLLTESGMCTDSTCFKYIFAADGSFIYELKINGVFDTKVGTYSISGDQLTICITGCSIPVTFAISGNILTLTYNDSTTGCDVTRVYKS